MINKSYNDEFKSVLSTLCHSWGRWGRDTTPEEVSTANELMELYCKMNMLQFTVELDEDTSNYKEFLKQID